MEKLTCYFSLLNPVENPTAIFGYPISIKKDKFNRI